MIAIFLKSGEKLNDLSVISNCYEKVIYSLARMTDYYWVQTQVSGLHSLC